MGRFECFVVGGFLLLLAAGCRGGERAAEGPAVAPLAAPMWTLTTASDEAEQHMTEGQRLWDLGKVEEAHERFKRAAAADPTLALAHLFVAQSQFQSPSEFRGHVQQAVERVANASEAEKLLVEIQRRSTFDDNAEGAMETAQRLVALEERNPRAWAQLALAQNALGRVEEARASMRKALEVAPAYTPAHAWLAFSYTQESADLVDPVKAEEYALKLVELEPNEPRSHDFLGDARRAQGKLQEAAAAYTRQAELDPKNWNAPQQRAHVHSFLGDYDAARADYDKAIALAPGNTKAAFAVYRAQVHLHAGDANAAIDELERLVQAVDGMGVPNPDGAKLNALGTQAFIALHTGRFDVAQRAIERATALWKKAAEQVGTEQYRRNQEANIAYMEGALAAYRGNAAVATRKAQEFMKLVEPNRNPRKNEPAHEILALLARRQKKYAEAVGHFEQAAPDNVANNYYHALALESAGRAEEAKRIFRRLANYYFNEPAVALLRKDILAKAS